MNILEYLVDFSSLNFEFLVMLCHPYVKIVLKPRDYFIPLFSVRVHILQFVMENLNIVHLVSIQELLNRIKEIIYFDGKSTVFENYG